MKILEKSYTDEGKQEFFSKAQIYMSGVDPDGQTKLAEQLGMNPNTTRVAVHRMRKRFRTFLKNIILETINTGEDPNEEIRQLLTLYSNPNSN